MTLSTAQVQPAAPATSRDLVEEVRREAVEAALAAVTYYEGSYAWVGHPSEPMPPEIVASRVLRKLSKQPAVAP